jgi:colanic acid/amylovoran biosynthesis protein
MKKVLVHGYFRANLGDDLFFRALAVRYPDVRFYLPTTRTEYDALLRDLPNVKVIDFCKVAKLTSRKIYMLPKLYSRLHMRRFDAVVCIGGSLFIDRKNPTKNDRIEAENYSFICDWEYARDAGVPYYVLGANWGPCYNDYFYDYFSRAFDSLEDLYFRDQASYREFAHKKAVRCGGDILMGNALISDACAGVARRKQIAVSPVNPAGKCEGAADPGSYYDSLATLCDSYVRQGYEVKLLSFCCDEGDETAIGEILSRTAEKQGIEPVYYRGDWKEMLRTIAASELMVASRFHATVIGWTLGVPVYSLTYSEKTVNLIRDCGLEGSFARIGEISGLTPETVAAAAALPENTEEFSGADRAFARLDLLLR